MTAGDWTDPLTLVLLGAVLVLVGLIVGWVVQAARARRTRIPVDQAPARGADTSTSPPPRKPEAPSSAARLGGSSRMPGGVL